MTKYRLLKDLPFHKKGTIFLYDGNQTFEEGDMEHPVSSLYFNDIGFEVLLGEWFVEVKDELKPKFKIGDYAVYEGKNIEYIKIFLIKQLGKEFVYNSTPMADGYSVSYHEPFLRKPTKIEKELYFR